MRQPGDLGEQSVWPSSMRAELKSRGFEASRSSVAVCQMIFCPAVESTSFWQFKRREMTRAMLPSTMGAGWLKAKLLTAPAV